KSKLFTRNSGGLSDGFEVNTKEAVVFDRHNFIGVVEVYVYQARDIHNICIYHKQDVYAKLCLTSDPESTFSTKIINGSGRDPIVMMSRVRNYLEDQLLGFALLENEFSLSSTDQFHSPAGFVQLSLAYVGSSPEVMAIPIMHMDLVAEKTVKDSEISECELEKIEFTDPKIVNENKMMVSEYFGIPCSSLDSEISGSLVISNAKNRVSLDMAVNVAESFSTATVNSIPVPKLESPPSIASKTSMEEHISTPKEKTADARDADSSSSRARSDSIEKPFVSVSIEPEQKVVQQEIVDMYMKSMQQFTESLAKMKLPLDINKGATKLENLSTTIVGVFTENKGEMKLRTNAKED
ncbi:hypothetical protein ES319_D13G158900v1, partial [Gossypium barbadense]